ncbi:Hypothetical predicted protein [Mytilus galloprovincialis]|uniref:Uncharacterized protein n=1 Tax=Mytilus galloprovincialis TaxID=29158 RepID=A0A8B6DHI8_MYTGA|nr:Hypothetical predicted protein [Mytilus galloprovincialis]
MENSLHYTSVNHAHLLIGAINQLRKRQELCDIILNCGNTMIPAHKLILSVSTPYFKSLVENKYKTDTSLRELRIDGLDGHAVQNIIEFFYTSAVSVDDVTVWTLLPAACLLQVEEIQNLCCDFLSSQLQLENCLRIHRVAAKCLCSGLLKESTEYIKTNFDQILEEEIFLELPVREMIGHLKRLNDMEIEDEKILQGVKCWVIYSVDDRQLLGYKLLQEFPKLKEELEKFLPAEYQVPQEEDLAEMMEEASNSVSQSSNENLKTADLSKIDNVDPLMCFECAEVFDSAEELKKHVQTHLASMYGKDLPSMEKNKLPFDVNSYNQMFNDSKNSTSDDSKSGNSYFDTYMKARGLDTPSFGGLKRERESTKSPGVPQKQVTITVTSTTGDGRELKFICPVCGKTCPSTDELGSHMESHSSFICNICGKSYSTRGNLQTHMKKHNGDKSVLCTYCNKSFTSPAVLKVHIRSHTGEKPFACETCGVGFAKNIHLKRHLSIHTGIKPHECEICHKRFSRSDHLKRHVQSIHTQDRPHICSLCGKDFVRKYELNKHMKQMHWGFTVGQNGNEGSTDTSFSQNQNETAMDTSFISDVYKGMQQLQGAFVMGDNNNMDESKGQGVSIKQEEVTGQSALIKEETDVQYKNGTNGLASSKGQSALKKEENGTKCENETNGLESSKGQSLSIVIKRDPDGYSISQ